MEYKISENIYKSVFNDWSIADLPKYGLDIDSTNKKTSLTLTTNSLTTKNKRKIKSVKKNSKKVKSWSNYMVKKIIDLKDRGYTVDDIATIMKTSRGSISGVIFRNNKKER